MDRAKRLIEAGHFPSQLPPCFNTRDLSTHYESLYKDWVALQETPKKGEKIPRAPDAKLETYSVARAGLLRRVTSITNPITQTYLSIHVSNHWANIVKIYRESRLSKSKPRFLKGASRAANIPSMQTLYEAKITMSVGYRYMLRTDISRFFPTIYTHSVPWAIHGKAVAKKNKKPTPKYFGNLLDMSIRQCQDGQTIGLPIGPDTSHIIAELISTAIDIELKKKLKVFPTGFRYVDDYYLFFSTLSEAETALAVLVKSLQDFELQINYEKTKICSINDIADDYWTHQLRIYEIATSGQKQLSDINHYFELAKDLARKNSDESVMTYAIKRVSATLVRKENWSIFESHVCHVAMAYPNTLQTVARLLYTYSKVGYSLNKSKLSRVINSIIEDHAPLAHHSEVAWCLWIVKELELDLTDQNIDKLSEIHSSVCALLLMDLHSSGKLSKDPKLTFWKSQETSESLFGDLWLLSYEAGIRGWGGLSDKHIISDPHFNLLRELDVHFYDYSATLQPFFQPSKEALENYELDEILNFEDLTDLLEYDLQDDGYEGVSVIDWDAIDEIDENMNKPF